MVSCQSILLSRCLIAGLLPLALPFPSNFHQRSHPQQPGNLVPFGNDTCAHYEPWQLFAPRKAPMKGCHPWSHPVLHSVQLLGAMMQHRLMIGEPITDNKINCRMGLISTLWSWNVLFFKAKNLYPGGKKDGWSIYKFSSLKHVIVMTHGANGSVDDIRLFECISLYHNRLCLCSWPERSAQLLISVPSNHNHNQNQNQNQNACAICHC